MVCPFQFLEYAKISSNGQELPIADVYKLPGRPVDIDYMNGYIAI